MWLNIIPFGKYNNYTERAWAQAVWSTISYCGSFLNIYNCENVKDHNKRSNLKKKRNNDVSTKGRFTQNMLHCYWNEIKSSQTTNRDYYITFSFKVFSALGRSQCFKHTSGKTAFLINLIVQVTATLLILEQFLSMMDLHWYCLEEGDPILVKEQGQFGSTAWRIRNGATLEIWQLTDGAMLYFQFMGLIVIKTWTWNMRLV